MSVEKKKIVVYRYYSQLPESKTNNYEYRIYETKSDFDVYNKVISARNGKDLFIVYNKFASFAVAFCQAELEMSDYDIVEHYKHHKDNIWRDDLGTIQLD